MHKVAEPTPITLIRLVLPTAGLSEIRHRRQLRKERPPIVPSIIQCIHGSLRFFFPLVTCIDVTNEMFADIVADVHLNELTVFC